MTRINRFASAKIVPDCPAEPDVSDSADSAVARTRSDVDIPEDSYGAAETMATSDVDEDADAPAVPFDHEQLAELDRENPPYLGDCDIAVVACDDFECNDKTIREEGSESSEATIREEAASDDKRMDSNDSLELPESLGGSVSEEACRTKHREKSIDSGVFLDSANVETHDNRSIVDSHVARIENRGEVAEKSDAVLWKNVRDAEADCHGQAVMPRVDNVDDILHEELDAGDTAALATGSNYCCTSKDCFEDDLLRCEESAKHAPSIGNIEEDSIAKTIAEIREMNEIIRNLCTSDDEQQNLAEERMVESLTAKMENDHDEVMRKIIESCTGVSADFQRESAIEESSGAELKEPGERLIAFRDGKLLPRRRAISDTDIAKEDILKTIQEAEKILSDSPYWNATEINAGGYDRGDSPVGFTTASKDDEKIKEEEDAELPAENSTEDITMNPTKEGNEDVFFLDPDVVESNLQRLTELTYFDQPRSHFEVHETMEKIAEEKKKIEDQKKESLETLSRKFDEIDKFVEDHDDMFCTSDKDHCGLMATDDIADDFDSLDEFHISPENLELPLTKTEIAENLKIEELEKELADEIEKHKILMDEYQSIIATDLQTISEAILEPAQADHQHVIDHEDVKESEISIDNGNIEESVASTERETKKGNKAGDESENARAATESTNVTSENVNDATAVKIDLGFDDDFLEEWKEPQRTYIKGKVYDFDEKKHGVRWVPRIR